VSLCREDGKEFARGLSNYSSDDLRRISGQPTDKIVQILGHCPHDEVVHRDNLAIIS
jgi:glutamate 5-kinase